MVFSLRAQRRWFLAGLASSCCALWCLPAQAQESELHTFHCFASCPSGAPDYDDIIVREIYTLASNDLTKFADWVAYRITPATIAGTQDRVWKADPWLGDPETLEPNDYDGANGALNTDRGHQAPLASFTGTPFWSDTNTLSNITPQKSDLNQGAWVKLENKEREIVLAEQTTLYVLSGPLFEIMEPPLPGADERHRVPSAYWKVLVTADGRATAFIMPQDTPRSADICSLRVTIDEVELRSRLFLYPDRDITQFGSLDSAIGCN
ncbi:DNA/RNA non-specific endonuclease [Sphingorhabdus soli]|uniref:Endonuclease n=1 Tax=Flavisphingopyxis soli TaxID=2601267 RepID=A0A5C6UMP4_9SPHN|nr:DNA/RNA non-specific endonuclease [Sphingorhabdus soli]TXC73376.1 DNA/RNA non-specific endonuclease [Sphingorhabdus soli]